ncbi:hypothetical protein SAMD00019534_002150 [Acytostelium subglobosum LB1]|uniref:hypothetical protein n=1 Tax=Acytostelium subglobosum LB1 TaxID=1410327 RepID=UPI000644A042|nr:hypothetical protein SAMD00019534_002150 [Acytostelium subglobosum LB1]GAM17040.1 hypothetical protein SAMD00019534_002150 [Acytostelium subglobosum LB1]|eukprot:XP_012759102.1 hypothetical protein SAMD00019534_002150 [Acytostelium subglobosum LB1]
MISGSSGSSSSSSSSISSQPLKKRRTTRGKEATGLSSNNSTHNLLLKHLQGQYLVNDVLPKSINTKYEHDDAKLNIQHHLLVLNQQQQSQQTQVQSPQQASNRWEDRPHHSSSSSPHVFFNTTPSISVDDVKFNANAALHQHQQQSSLSKSAGVGGGAATNFTFVSPSIGNSTGVHNGGGSASSSSSGSSSKKKMVSPNLVSSSIQLVNQMPQQQHHHQTNMLTTTSINTIPYIQPFTTNNNILSNNNNSNNITNTTQSIKGIPTVVPHIHKPIPSKPSQKRHCTPISTPSPMPISSLPSLPQPAIRSFPYITISDKLNAFKPITKEFPPTTYTNTSFPSLHFASPSTPTYSITRPHYSLSPFIPIEKEPVYIPSPCTTTNTAASAAAASTTNINHHNHNHIAVHPNVNNNLCHAVSKQLEQHKTVIANANNINTNNNTLQKKKKKSQGYCECCNTEFESLKAHLESKEHRSFAEKDKNYAKIDSVIMSLSLKSY